MEVRPGEMGLPEGSTQGAGSAEIALLRIRRDYCDRGAHGFKIG